MGWGQSFFQTTCGSRRTPHGLRRFPTPPSDGATSFIEFDGGVEGHAAASSERGRVAAGLWIGTTRYGLAARPIPETRGYIHRTQQAGTQARPVEANDRGERFLADLTTGRFARRVPKGFPTLTNFRRHEDGYYDPRSFVMPVFFSAPSALQCVARNFAKGFQVSVSCVPEQSRTRSPHVLSHAA